MPMRFPFYVDGRGRTAAADAEDDDYIRDLMEAVLMTSPGERVNQPEFGSGVMGMAFSPASSAMQSAVQAAVQANIQRWLSDIVLVQSVEVQVQDSTLSITVQYVVRSTQQLQQATFLQTDEEASQ